MPSGKLDSTWHGSLALLALALLAAGCGGASKVKSSRPSSPYEAAFPSATVTPAPVHAARANGYVKQDGDKDNDELLHPVPAESDELRLLRTYGPKASTADARAITTLVKRYYAASVAGDAARACSMLLSGLATGLAAQSRLPVSGARDTCAGHMSPLLALQHQRLIAEDVLTMKVVEVHVKGTIGLAVLGFRTTPLSQIILQREGRAWKIAALVGTYMP